MIDNPTEKRTASYNRAELKHGYYVQIEVARKSDWSDWMKNIVLSEKENGRTVLSGTVVDQSGLFGLIKRLRDFGAVLISAQLIN